MQPQDNRATAQPPVEGNTVQADTAHGYPSVDDEPSFWFDVRVWIRDVMISIAIAVVVIVFLYQPVKVEGTSMMPWLQDQERIFVNKFVYRFEDVRRNDIVVFRFPLDPTKSYIKRVVGLPGDEIELVRGQLYVNGGRVEEPYIPEEFRDLGTYPPLTVPAGSYYVLGDHRNTSNDSRTWGTVSRDFVVGKAVFAYWPIDQFGVVQ
jgi:signal peptidase I